MCRSSHCGTARQRSYSEAGSTPPASTCGRSAASSPRCARASLCSLVTLRLTRSSKSSGAYIYSNLPCSLTNKTQHPRHTQRARLARRHLLPRLQALVPQVGPHRHRHHRQYARRHGSRSARCATRLRPGGPYLGKADRRSPVLHGQWLHQRLPLVLWRMIRMLLDDGTVLVFFVLDMKGLHMVGQNGVWVRT